jgi:threonine aldolase
VSGLEATPAEVETNMVRFRVHARPAQQLVDRLRAQGVLVLAVGPDTIRAVTSLMVSSDDIRAAVAVVTQALE